MSQRYRISRALREEEGVSAFITLDECKQYFETKPDFTYTSVYTIEGATRVSIEGDFFMWRCGEASIPFRHFQGDLYVSGTNEAVIPKMLEIAAELGADVAEG